ncbi:MAG TPA: hypothetical protein VHF27_08000 [Acidimicrobiales bacterium]|nr:hypothetical protein [Acidimicrobiales bacterium]
MSGLIRRSLVASAVFVAFLGLAAGPAAAQVGPDGERLYTGVNPPAQGSVLAPRGVPAVPGPGTALGVVATPTAGQVATMGVQGQVLPLQVSSGAVAGASRAPVRGLAFTGADVATLVPVGFAAVTLGVVLTRRGRPRSAPTS